MSIAAWAVYDRETMHRTRKLKGWDAASSLVRLHNAALPLLRTLTLAELELCRGGGDGRPTYFAARGVVYDVTDSPSFTQGGGYTAFAGRDASFALATMSLHPNDVGRRGVKLSEEDQASLDDWVVYFDQKYRRVGVLPDSDTPCNAPPLR